MKNEQQYKTAIADLSGIQSGYIEVTEQEIYPTDTWYAIDFAIKSMEKLQKIDKAIEEMKALADPKNTILGFDEKMGLKTAMNILVRNIGE